MSTSSAGIVHGQRSVTLTIKYSVWTPCVSGSNQAAFLHHWSSLTFLWEEPGAKGILFGRAMYKNHFLILGLHCTKIVSCQVCNKCIMQKIHRLSHWLTKKNAVPYESVSWLEALIFQDKIEQDFGGIETRASDVHNCGFQNFLRTGWSPWLESILGGMEKSLELATTRVVIILINVIFFLYPPHPA